MLVMRRYELAEQLSATGIGALAAQLVLAVMARMQNSRGRPPGASKAKTWAETAGSGDRHGVWGVTGKSGRAVHCHKVMACQL